MLRKVIQDRKTTIEMAILETICGQTIEMFNRYIYKQDLALNNFYRAHVRFVGWFWGLCLTPFSFYPIPLLSYLFVEAQGN